MRPRKLLKPRCGQRRRKPSEPQGLLLKLNELPRQRHGELKRLKPRLRKCLV